MIAEFKSKSNMGIGVGIVLEIIGYALISAGNDIIGVVILLVGGILFLYGCFMYAKAKGYPAAMGLLGFLGLIGLIILVVMPDKMKEGTPAAPSPPAA